ncbi:hypothetical protein [Leisingera sp. NJS204]|uniref:hypothetical protein n=1 Tax=Leisingera sp. NJS204 TaxID=2508307 RepID=UPI0020C754F7|nr:hypothetical protein [Leisingera sp. NJS204]
MAEFAQKAADHIRQLRALPDREVPGAVQRQDCLLIFGFQFNEAPSAPLNDPLDRSIRCADQLKLGRRTASQISSASATSVLTHFTLFLSRKKKRPPKAGADRLPQQAKYLLGWDQIVWS